MSQSQRTPPIDRTHLARAGMSAAVVLLSLLTRQPVIAAQIATAAVAGVVVESRTRQPLAGALVELGGAARPMATDAEGQFRFDVVPVGPRELVVSLVGYAQIPPFVDFRTGQAFDLFRAMFPLVPSVGATLEF